MKLSISTIHALAGMILQRSCELRAAARGGKVGMIKRISEQFVTASGVDNYYFSQLVYKVCEFVGFDLLRVDEFCHQALARKIQELSTEYDY